MLERGLKLIFKGVLNGLPPIQAELFMSALFMSTLFMSRPINVQNDRFMSGPIHVQTVSCPKRTDSCLTLFMSDPIHAQKTDSCQALFMSDPIHAQKTDSCQALFMSDPIHVQKVLFMSNN